MMNTCKTVVTAVKPRLHQHVRLLSTTQVAYAKSAPVNKKTKKHSQNLMENAPNWQENNATESEADVKADHEPSIDPQKLKEQTAEWVRTHKDSQGNLRK